MQENKKRISILFAWTAVLLWMLLIFNLSAQAAEESDKLSKGIARIIVETVEKVVPQADFDINRFNHILRKNTHFFAYLILGVLVVNALRKGGVHIRRGAAIAVGICILYAASDEFHQLFVPGRGAQLTDVIIDSSGAGIGIAAYSALRRIIKNMDN